METSGLESDELSPSEAVQRSVAAGQRHGPKPTFGEGYLLVSGIGLALLVEIWLLDGSGGVGARLLLSAFAVLAAGSLVLCRRRPNLAYALNGLAVTAFIGLGALGLGGPSDFYQYTNLVALYFVALRHGGLKSWAALGVSLVGIAAYFAAFPGEGTYSTIAMVWLLWLTAWLIGRVQRGRNRQQALEAERDLSNEVAEVRRVRLALEAERASMARELHDILGHTLSVMLVHAGAARRALPDGADSDDARKALTTIESTGRTALDDLDRVLDLMRRSGDAADEQPRRPLPGIADLADLVTNVRDGGAAEVALSVDLGGAVVPRPLQLAVYRIAQEALTNVIRHAAATRVEVRLTSSGAALDLEVQDDGRGITTPALRGGSGVVGMRERAEAHGGTLDLVDAPGGGALIRCRIPLDRS